VKKLSIFLIIAGLLITAYPFMDRAFTAICQAKALRDFNRAVDTYDIQPDNSAVKDYTGLGDVFDGGLDDDTAPTQQSAPSQVKPAPDYKIMGVLKIDKINLNLPILDGATALNMKIGAARIKGTGNIGEIGNIGLAGHRSHTYGRFFNRLDELDKGDKIYITTGDKTYEYTVYKKIIVLPSDTSVLNRNNKDKILTLVTCHPIYNSTHRLIIQAVLK
jgi:LPXTG-site transpeptidase (sortase) family protein